MEFRRLVEARCSVRNFRAESVPLPDLREMVRLAGLAPSPNNAQPWRFIAVTDHDLLERMAGAVRQKLAALLPTPPDPDGRTARARVEWFSTFFSQAPAVFAVALGQYRAVIADALAGSGLTAEIINEMRGHPDIQSIGAAVEHLLLAATDLGYGGCWMSGPLLAREELEQLLGLVQPWRLAALVAVGRPAQETPAARERKSLDEIFEHIG